MANFLGKSHFALAASPRCQLENRRTAPAGFETRARKSPPVDGAEKEHVMRPDRPVIGAIVCLATGVALIVDYCHGATSASRISDQKKALTR